MKVNSQEKMFVDMFALNVSYSKFYNMSVAKHHTLSEHIALFIQKGINVLQHI